MPSYTGICVLGSVNCMWWCGIVTTPPGRISPTETTLLGLTLSGSWEYINCRPCTEFQEHSPRTIRILPLMYHESMQTG